jgi:hypothetical protein
MPDYFIPLTLEELQVKLKGHLGPVEKPGKSKEILGKGSKAN